MIFLVPLAALWHSVGSSIADRIADRGFPSVCADGGAADALCSFDGAESKLSEPQLANLARHDLIILSVDRIGLTWADRFPGRTGRFTSDSVANAQAWRRELRRRNPHSMVLVELPYDQAPPSYLPASSPFWRKGGKGELLLHVDQRGERVDIGYEDPGFLHILQAKAHALIRSGVADGVVLRRWDIDSPARLGVVQAVRRGVGRFGMVVLETGANRPELSAKYVNGVLIDEIGSEGTPWTRLTATIDWTNGHVRKPAISVLEAITIGERTSLFDMRMVTTLALTSGAAYVSFRDSKGHDWYDFWERTLGKPVGPAFNKDGALWREFDNGTVIYNPPTNGAVTVEFHDLRTSMAKSMSLHRLSVQPGDGDIALSHPPKH